MDAYKGTNPGKRVARDLTHEAMRKLNPYAYSQAPHLYLAGQDAGDVVEARRRGVRNNLLFAAERKLERVKEARLKVPSECIIHDDVQNVAQGIGRGKVGILFLDTCGQLTGDLADLVNSMLPYLQSNGVIAINLTYGRDYLAWSRHKMKDKLSYSYRESRWWKATATARIASHMMPRVFFSTAIAYSNTGEGKSVGMPMLTLIGRKTNTRKVTEPAYFIRYGKSGQDLTYTESTSSDPTLHAFKAHLPRGYKGLINSLG